MKQENVNTFNEGLNFDLNPLTTPNNVLTDCVNGTFVTFNGDELALQNDAGNTTIKYDTGTELIDVSLSPGYYPIGIKEYGGILYIVSACTPESLGATLWVSGTIYTAGKIVFILSEADPIYYRCIVNTSILDITPPGEDSTHWEFVPTEELSRIEFGSYPSPDRPDLYANPNLINYDVTGNKSKLYLSKILNDFQFRAGNYVKFTELELGSRDLSNVSYYSYDASKSKTYHKKIYKIRLLQQLTNGSIDLTQFVWDQYAKHNGYPLNEGAELNFWFDDPTFKFYCPNNYKGKLAIVTEIEPLKTFRLSETSIDFTEGQYTLNFKVTLLNESSLVIDRIQFWYWIDDGIKQSVVASFVNGIASVTITHDQYMNPLNPNHIEKFMYEITPLEISSTPGLSYKDGLLPINYLIDNKYIITGTRLLTTKYDDIVLERSIDDYTCEINYTGKAYTTKFVLKNSNGDNLNPQLEVTPDEYFFRQYDQNNVPNPFSLGTYTYENDEKAILKEWENTSVLFSDSVIKPLLESQLVSYTGEERCTKVTLSIKTSKLLSAGSIVNVIQGDTILMNRSINDPLIYTCLIKPGINFEVIATYGTGYNAGTASGNGNILVNSTFTLPIVCNFQIKEVISLSDPDPALNTYRFYGFIPMPDDMQNSQNKSGKSKYGVENWSTTSFNKYIGSEPWIGYISELVNAIPKTHSEIGIIQFDFDNETIPYLSPENPVDAPWLELNPSDYLLVGNEIFKKLTQL